MLALFFNRPDFSNQGSIAVWDSFQIQCCAGGIFFGRKDVFGMCINAPPVECPMSYLTNIVPCHCYWRQVRCQSSPVQICSWTEATLSSWKTWFRWLPMWQRWKSWSVNGGKETFGICIGAVRDFCSLQISVQCCAELEYSSFFILYWWSDYLILSTLVQMEADLVDA